MSEKRPKKVKLNDTRVYTCEANITLGMIGELEIMLEMKLIETWAILK